jgi:hypothetical protein
MPLPNWQDLMKSILWFKAKHVKADEILTFNSSYSIFTIASLRSDHFIHKINVFIPFFFCNQSIQALREKPSVHLFFYDVNEDLTANIPSIYKIAKTNSPDIILGVHYFGINTDLKPLACIAKEYGAWLIEDLVHVFSLATPSKYYGDFIINSPHKHHPIPGGSSIKIYGAGPSNLGHVKDKLANGLQNLANPNTNIEKMRLTSFCIKWALKRILQKHLNLHRKPNHESNVNNYTHKFHHVNYFIINLLKFTKNKEGDLEIKKNAAHKTWSLILLNFFPYRKIRMLQCNSTPYYASFSSDDISDKLYEELSDMGWPVMRWPDLPPEVLQNNTHGQLAIHLRKKFIHLPSHHDVRKKQIYSYYIKYLSTISSRWAVKELQESEWISHFHDTNATYLQSWLYGEIKKSRSKFIRTKRVLVLNDENIPIAIAQLIGIKFFFLPTIYQLNRGPVLINKNCSNRSELSLKIISIATIQKFLKSNWSFLYKIHPEMEATEFSDLGMNFLNFKKSNATPWASGLIRLCNTEEELNRKLSSKWRNSLKKGLSCNQIVIKQAPNNFIVEQFLGAYMNHKRENKYEGIANFDIKAIANKHCKEWSVNFYSAFDKDDVERSNPLGMLLTLGVGDTSTYLASTTTTRGREAQSSSVLLWHSICDAKKCGYKLFDIGGLNKDTTPGVSHFKKGLNSEIYELSGVWRLFK